MQSIRGLLQTPLDCASLRTGSWDKSSAGKASGHVRLSQRVVNRRIAMPLCFKSWLQIEIHDSSCAAVHEGAGNSDLANHGVRQVHSAIPSLREAVKLYETE